MNTQPVRPSRLWYWVAGTAVLGAVVWLALGFLFWFRSMIREVDEFRRVPIPGQAELSFDRPGSYTVYFEGLGAGDETATIPAFDISIAPVGGGEKVPIRPYGGSELYNMAGHSGRAVGTSRSRSRSLSRPLSPSARASAGTSLSRCS